MALWKHVEGFSRLLASASFVVLGAFNLALAVLYALTMSLPPELGWIVMAAGALSAASIVAGIGLLKGWSWSWFVGLAISVLSLYANLFVVHEPMAAAIDAAMLVLLILCARRYLPIPAPKPLGGAAARELIESAPLLRHSFVEKKRFVRKRGWG